METTTLDYLDGNDSYDEGPVEPCDSEAVNYLGAQISFIYYFMFLFSLVGNGLVLVIIHRWVDKQNSAEMKEYKTNC